MLEKMCIYCKYEGTGGINSPWCNNCGSRHASFEPEEHFEKYSSELKDCSTCKYKYLSHESYPCSSCYEYGYEFPKWVSTHKAIIKNCNSCRLKNADKHKEPCTSCYICGHRFPFWR